MISIHNDYNSLRKHEQKPDSINQVLCNHVRKNSFV
jgi:hypothetical protein